MTSAVGPGMQIALLGALIATIPPGGGSKRAPARCQRGEDWVEPLHHGIFAANHQAVAAFQSPHATRGADVEVGDAFAGKTAGAADVVLPMAVTTIDDAVAGLHEIADLADGLIRCRAGRQHDPDHPRRGECLDQPGETRPRLGPLAGEGPAVRRIEIVNHARMTLAQQPAHDIGTHASEPDHADLHAAVLSLTKSARGRRAPTSLAACAP